VNIKEYIENNKDMVRISRSQRYPEYCVVKYSKKAFWKGNWDNYLMNMRGLVIDDNYNPIVMPFKKIFNQYENGANFDRDDNVTAVRKINGFMGAVTYSETYKKNIVSTTGSLDSDFANIAEEYIGKLPLQKGFTYLFEIIDIRDPHVIIEKPGAYFLSKREVKWDGIEENDQIKLDDECWKGILRPEHFDCRFSDLCKIVKEVKHEGYVVHKDGHSSIKIKSPFYKTTKFFGRIGMEKFEKIIKNKENAKKCLEEEYYPLLDHVINNSNCFFTMNEQEKFSYIKNWLNNQ